MAKLIARAPVEVRGRDYRPGDTFEADPKDVVPRDGAEAAPVPSGKAAKAAENARRAQFEADEARRKAESVAAGGGGDEDDGK